MKAMIWIILVLTAVLPFRAADLRAKSNFLGGEVRFVGGAGSPSEITVQFLSPNFYATTKLQPNSSQRLSLQRQMYNVIVQDQNGKVIAELQFLVEDEDWLFVFDETPLAEKIKKTFPLDKTSFYGFFYNTTDTCHAPGKISLLIDDLYAGEIEAGSSREFYLSRGSHTFYVYLDGKLKFVIFRKIDGKNWSAFSGCTDPKALEKDDEKVMLAIYNTTDKCSNAAEIFHLTVRLDGKPLAGVAPGNKTIVYIEKGDHYLEVLKGDTSERLIKGVRSFQKNSLLHHGCSKPGGKAGLKTIATDPCYC